MDLAAYLSVEVKSADLPPLPLLHDGALAHMAWTKPTRESPNLRYVVRAWRTSIAIQKEPGQGTKSLLLATMAVEDVRRPYGILTVVDEGPVGLEDAGRLWGPAFKQRARFVEKAGGTGTGDTKAIYIVSLD
jgi:hypothetical protein